MSDTGGAPMTYDLRHKRVWVAGHRGMVGSALVRRLRAAGCEVLTADRERLDLRDGRAVRAWLAASRPEAIFLAAATVGGIAANIARPAEFISDNLLIAANVIDAAHQYNVRKLMFLGSSCVYPRLASQPMREEDLMTGPLEPTNEPYALAKLAGISMCAAYRKQYGSDFISVIPTNLFGPGDNLDPAANHVVPGLIAKIDAAKRTHGAVEIWGSGTPRREFLYVDDAADAMVYVMQRYSEDGVINIGCGSDLSIRELADAIARCIGFTGEFAYDTSRPDGMPLKALDSSRLTTLGWHPRTDLEDGLTSTYDWFVQARASAYA